MDEEAESRPQPDEAEPPEEEEEEIRSRPVEQPPTPRPMPQDSGPVNALVPAGYKLSTNRAGKIMAALPMVCDGLLIATTAYAMYDVTLMAPFAFAAAAIVFIHTVFSFLKCSGRRSCENIKEFAQSISEILPLSLILVELYRHSKNCSQYALVHMICIFPLAYELVTKIIAPQNTRLSNAATSLKDVTILANIISILFLSYSDDNYLYGILAVVAFSSKFVSKAMEKRIEGAGDISTTLFNTLTFLLVAQIFV